MAARLSDTSVETLEHLSTFCRNSQLEAIFASNVRLANWFQAQNRVVRQEIRRRAGEEQDEPAHSPDIIEQRTRELTDDELEAIGMGFGTITSREGESIPDDLITAIGALYDPVRREYLRRSVATGGTGTP
jgi:hypothetical protein